MKTLDLTREVDVLIDAIIDLRGAEIKEEDILKVLRSFAQIHAANIISEAIAEATKRIRESLKDITRNNC